MGPTSVASSPLLWGGYADKLTTLGDVSWDSIHQQALSRQGVRVVIAAPHQTAEGLAALIGAVAAHLETTTLSEADVGQADAWLTETLGDRNAQTPPRPAEAFATAQGRTVGDIGLLTAASWHQVGLDNSANFTVMPATPVVTLDYPLVVFADKVPPEAQQAVESFRQFLLEPAQQQALTRYGFEPAASSSVQADGRAARRLLRWSEREIRP